MPQFKWNQPELAPDDMGMGAIAHSPPLFPTRYSPQKRVINEFAWRSQIGSALGQHLARAAPLPSHATMELPLTVASNLVNGSCLISRLAVVTGNVPIDNLLVGKIQQRHFEIFTPFCKITRRNGWHQPWRRTAPVDAGAGAWRAWRGI